VFRTLEDEKEKQKKGADRRAQSFNKREIKAACDILSGLLHEKDIRILIGTPEVRSLHRKFLKMQKSMEE